MIHWTRFTMVAFACVSVGFALSCNPRGDDNTPRDQLYQVSTLAALVSGSYDGQQSFGEVLDRGDFGLGTFDALDGELIILDGTAYRIPANGVAEEVDDTETTPFAAVTFWDSDTAFELTGAQSCADLQTNIDIHMQDLGIPYAIRINGEFSTLLTRSEERQNPPYRPLTDVLKGQVEFDLRNINATLVGFRLPEYMNGSNASGYHFHAISSDRESGGHVLDCQVSDVQVELDRIDSWQVNLATN